MNQTGVKSASFLQHALRKLSFSSWVKSICSQSLWSEEVEHFLGSDRFAREYWRLDGRVLARLTTSELHDEVEKVFRSVRLEGQDEFVIIQAERVGSVNGYRRELVSDLNMGLHDATPLLEGYAVPFTLLRERVDEEILGPCWLGIAWLPKILGWPEHCKV